MIELTINNKPFQIKTNWNEVTFDQYLEIVKAKNISFADRISVYSGIPLDLVNQMKLSQMDEVCDFVSFMENFETIDAFAMAYESGLTVSEQPYWKIEKVKQLLKGNTNPILIGAEVVDIYTSDADGNGGIKINDKPVTEVIGMCAFFLRLSQSSLSDTKG